MLYGTGSGMVTTFLSTLLPVRPTRPRVPTNRLAPAPVPNAFTSLGPTRPGYVALVNTTRGVTATPVLPIATMFSLLQGQGTHRLTSSKAASDHTSSKPASDQILQCRTHEGSSGKRLVLWGPVSYRVGTGAHSPLPHSQSSAQPRSTRLVTEPITHYHCKYQHWKSTQPPHLSTTTAPASPLAIPPA